MKIDGEWYKFNDEYVDIAQEENVYDSNFGGNYVDAKLNKSTACFLWISLNHLSDLEKELETWESISNNTAYMLVYIA